MSTQLKANALTTLERVKENLGISSSVSELDSILTSFINEASDFVHGYIGRNLAFTEEHVEIVGGSSSNYLQLRNRPIVTIHSIKRGEEEIKDYLEDPNDFKAGVVYRDNTWPMSRYTTGLTQDVIGRRRNYTVTYSYGYVLPKDAEEENPRTLPYDIESVVLSLVHKKHLENQRDSYGLKELRQGRLMYKFNDSDLSSSELRTLKRYKNLVVGEW